MNKVLYISYDGMLEPLGQSQVLQYLNQLSCSNKIFLVSYEKQVDWDDVTKREQLKKSILKNGISWIPLRYHKSPSGLATAYDLLVGIMVCFWLAFRYNIQIVHARSYVSSVIALVLKIILGEKFIFDMRGFWADERVDGGIWQSGSRMFRVAKWFEKKFLINADVVVSLTHAAVEIMKQFPYLKSLPKRFEVIPTCTNTELFVPTKTVQDEENDNSSFVLGYVGSVGTWYLFDEIAESFKYLLEVHPNAKLLIINRNDHQYIKSVLSRYGVHGEAYDIISADFNEVRDHIRKMSAGIFFIKPVYSKLASCPTKMGEFLACGVPCMSNSGVGDIEKILKGENVGVIVTDFSSVNLKKKVVQLYKMSCSNNIKGRCMATAKLYLSIENGVCVYNEIYQSLLGDVTKSYF